MRPPVIRRRHLASPRLWAKTLSRIWCSVVASLALSGLTAPVAFAEGPPADDAVPQATMVFSARLLPDVHRNDAIAATRAWSRILMQERNVRLDPDSRVVEGLAALAEVLRSGEGQVFTVASDEYLALSIDPPPTQLFVSTIDGDATEEYLLLVQRGGLVESLDGLRDRTLLLFTSARTTLALCWLDAVLLENGLSPSHAHFDRVKRVTRLTGAVLPVFFGQADACVVSRRGLEVMSELNPQVGKKLRVLATSPPLLPAVGFILPEAEELFEEVDLLGQITLLPTTPAGLQLLNLFGADGTITVATSMLDETRRLIETHQRLVAEWEGGSTRTGPSLAGPASSAGSVQ